MNNKNNKRKYFYITASFTETSNENMMVAEIDQYYVGTFLDKYHRTEFTTDLSKTLFFDNKLWAQVVVTILKRHLNLYFRIVTTTCPVLDDNNSNLITYKNFAKHPRRREFVYVHRLLVNFWDKEFNTQEE